jgi:hypothetical protein
MVYNFYFAPNFKPLYFFYFYGIPSLHRRQIVDCLDPMTQMPGVKQTYRKDTALERTDMSCLGH